MLLKQVVVFVEIEKISGRTNGDAPAASPHSLRQDKKMAPAIKALIFDMDGTLVDSERLHWQAWNETLRRYGFRVPDFEDFNKYVGVSDEQMATEFSISGELGASPTELVTRKCATYLGLVPEIRLLAGVEMILDRCRDIYRMAVASSSPSEELAAILDHHGLADRFEYVVGGDMVSKKKPDPEIYLLVTDRLGLFPGECIAFEDSQSGITAAKRAGLTAVAIPHAMSMNHDFSQADAVLTSLAEVDARLLLRLAGGS